MATTELATAIALRDAADAAQIELGRTLGTMNDATGNAGVVFRTDLGLVIAYASTATHSLEARATPRGAFRHRINLDTYDRAADIPTSFRKLRKIAQVVEDSAETIATAYWTTVRAELALTAANEYRDDATRQQARDALARLD